MVRIAISDNSTTNYTFFITFCREWCSSCTSHTYLPLQVRLEKWRSTRVYQLYWPIKITWHVWTVCDSERHSLNTHRVQFVRKRFTLEVKEYYRPEKGKCLRAFFYPLSGCNIQFYLCLKMTISWIHSSRFIKLYFTRTVNGYHWTRCRLELAIWAISRCPMRLSLFTLKFLY